MNSSFMTSRPVIITWGSDLLEVGVSQGEYVKVKCFLIDSSWSLQRHSSACSASPNCLPSFKKDGNIGLRPVIIKWDSEWLGWA